MKEELGELHDHLTPKMMASPSALMPSTVVHQQPTSSCAFTRPTAALLAASSPATAAAGEQLSVRKSGVDPRGRMHAGPRLKRRSRLTRALRSA